MTLTSILVRLGLAASLIISAASHAYLYVHGYQHIPQIGPAFMAQASLSFAIALLILVGGPAWLRWAGAAVAAGSLVAFVLSRTVGLSGFSERGWEPAPYAAVSVAAEVATVALWGLGSRPVGVRPVSETKQRTRFAAAIVAATPSRASSKRFVGPPGRDDRGRPAK